MLWLALHLPLLSLEAFCATLPPGAAQGPVALLAEHRITAVNAAAAARGVRSGMKRATALALAAELLLGEADAARDAAALQAVAFTALAFTPSVTLHDGQPCVLMEVRASLRLFAGVAPLVERLRAALAPLAHRVRIAAAPTALGAALIARWGRSAGASFDPLLGPHATRLPALVQLLSGAPVWLLGPGREHWEALQGMGLHTLADLRDLPRAGLARRFGEGLLDELDRAFGRAPDPRRWIELPAAFEAGLELHQRADHADQVLGAASVLLARLVAWAGARQVRIAAFTLSMQHEPRHRERGGTPPATTLRVELAEPALDPSHLQLLLRERLARVQLAAPTLELHLRCRDTVASAPPNAELFPTRGSESPGLARLLERLRARLGDAQVQRLEPVADHRPERASRSLPALAGGASVARSAAPLAGRLPQRTGRAGRSDTSAASPREDRALPLHRPVPLEDRALPLHRPVPLEDRALPLHRPVWLLPEPLPLHERQGLPLLEGQPLQLVAGPERIEAGWWDGEPAARDYFIALANDGSLVWVWRRRLAVAVEPGGEGGGVTAHVQWMLQGRFA